MSLQIWKTFISLPISFSFSFEKNNQNSDRRHQFVYTVLYIPTNRSVFCVLLWHLLALFNCRLMFVVCSRFFLIACTKITKTLKMYGQAIHVSLSVFYSQDVWTSNSCFIVCIFCSQNRQLCIKKRRNFVYFTSTNSGSFHVEIYCIIFLFIPNKLFMLN